LKRTLLAAGIVICSVAAAPARAETRSKLFPLSSQGLPKSLKAAPAKLTRVLARSFNAETTTVPIDDAAGLIGCSLSARTCLEEIASSVGVSRIVFGRVEARDEGAMVKLTTFELGKGESSRSIAISGTTADEMVDSLREALDVTAEKPTETRSIEVPLVDPPPAASGGVTTGTWAMVIGGGVTAGVGIGVFVSANSLRTQVRTVPRETVEEIQHLKALEKAGRTRVQIGGALMAIGGVVGTIGVIRMIVQKKSSRPEQPRFDVVPENGGASVRFSMEWR
jgi:hypothetical protein